VALSSAVFVGAAATAGIWQMKGDDGVQAGLVFLGLAGPPLGLASAGLLLLPSMGMLEATGRRPTLARLGLGSSLLGLVGAGYLVFSAIASFGGNAEGAERVGTAEGAERVGTVGLGLWLAAPALMAGFALTEAVLLSRYAKGGGLSEQVSFGVVPTRGGGQAGLSVRF
jgi:hypothetical protein